MELHEFNENIMTQLYVLSKKVMLRLDELFRCVLLFAILGGMGGLSFCIISNFLLRISYSFLNYDFVVLIIDVILVGILAPGFAILMYWGLCFSVLRIFNRNRRKFENLRMHKPLKIVIQDYLLELLVELLLKVVHLVYSSFLNISKILRMQLAMKLLLLIYFRFF